jgi:hypothetical protein
MQFSYPDLAIEGADERTKKLCKKKKKKETKQQETNCHHIIKSEPLVGKLYRHEMKNRKNCKETDNMT